MKIRKKRGKTPRFVKGKGYITSIAFNSENYKYLQESCLKNKTNMSALINKVVKKTTWSESDYLNNLISEKEQELQQMKEMMKELKENDDKTN